MLASSKVIPRSICKNLPTEDGLADIASTHPGHAPGDATSGTWRLDKVNR